MSFNFPELPYGYDALEPHIDTMTMEIHYSRHHKAYFTKFMDAIENTDLKDKTLEEIFAGISSQAAGIRNNGGGFYNHNIFWRSMSPNGGGEPSGALGEAINKKWGSFDEFKTVFANAAATRFGSGFAWLIVTANGELEVTSTANQDNPLMETESVKGTPILALDVWEHAYYLKYQNKRPDYINAFWNVANWQWAGEEFERLK
jgi:Fe-Mn family superoxide dismutase